MLKPSKETLFALAFKSNTSGGGILLLVARTGFSASRGRFWRLFGVRAARQQQQRRQRQYQYRRFGPQELLEFSSLKFKIF